MAIKMCKAGKPDLFPGFIMNIYLFTNARVSIYDGGGGDDDEEFAAFIYAHTHANILWRNEKEKKIRLIREKQYFPALFTRVCIFVRICTACC